MAKQLMPVDRYIELVQNIGIESAYTQRHRGTGRTKRLVLRTLALLSEGEHIVMRYGYGKDKAKYCMCKHFIGELRDLAKNYMHDIDWTFRESSIDCITSGGRFALLNEDADHRGSWMKLDNVVEIKDEY